LVAGKKRPPYLGGLFSLGAWNEKSGEVRLGLKEDREDIELAGVE
jgi:hypothetical protein